MPCRALRTLMALATTLVAARARGGGFELVEQSPEAVATAGAQTAAADGPAAVYYDPAALAFQPGLSVQAGANLLAYRGVVALGAQPDVASSALYATPTVFAGARIAARYAVGIGVFDPFAWSISYPSDWAGRFVGQSLDLRALAVNPSVALRPLGWLAIGFGVDVVPATLSYRRATNLGGGAEGQLAIDVTGTGVGGNASIFVRVVPRWLDAAFAYRSAIDLDLSSSAAKITLPLPHALTFAVATRPVAGLTITTDVRLTLWQDVRALSFSFSDATMPKEVVTLNYADSVDVRAGASYRFCRDAANEPRLVVRLGLGWEQAPTSPAATSPLLPDGDRILVGGGAGGRWHFLALDVAYLAAIATDALGVTQSFAGSYKSVAHTVSVALTLRLPNFPSRLDEPEFKP